MTFIENKTFSKVDYSADALEKTEYDNCTFIDCIFAGANMGGISFTECIFEGCNLSMPKIRHTALKNVEFRNCKMLGFNFNFCDPFLLEVSFEECQLHLSSFYSLKLKNTRFIHCDLHEVDFVEADLTGAVFENCDLSKAIFQNTNLEKADLRTARNYSIDPETNKLKKAKFSKESIGGLLDKYQIIIE